MPLTLTDEQEMLREAAAGFLAAEAPPAQLRRLRDESDPDGFDRATWAKMAEMGWTGVMVPEGYGGAGMGAVAAGMIAAEIGANLTASPFLSSAVVGATALARSGSDAQKERWLPQIASGAAILALAVDEGRRHDPAKTALAANRSGNGFRLDGVKVHVPDGHVADAVIVAARTAGSPGETDGITLFLVETGAPGVSASTTRLADGRPVAALTFAGVEATGEAVLGEVDGGFLPLETMLSAGRAGLSAELTGAARAAFGQTVDYLKVREQFGQKIGSFQALQHRCAHLLTEIELANSAVLKALQDLDAEAPTAPLTVSLAKAKAGQVAQLAGQEGVQIHGGIGMTDDADIGLYLKRIRVAAGLWGDANFHAERLARARGY